MSQNPLFMTEYQGRYYPPSGAYPPVYPPSGAYPQSGYPKQVPPPPPPPSFLANKPPLLATPFNQPKPAVQESSELLPLSVTLGNKPFPIKTQPKETGPVSPPYLGPRDESFKNMIKKLLKMGKLVDKYIDCLVNDKNMEIYKSVFTHSSVDEKNNYEFLETLGDVTVNKITVWYLSRRFEHLRTPGVLSKLKNYLTSKKGLFSITESLNKEGINFWEFISASQEIRDTKKKPLLEDVFEAFIGATENIIDTNIRRGAGYEICYCIVESILDKVEISLKYEDVFDAKSRLKETFDYFKDYLGQPLYEAKRDGEYSHVTLYSVIGGTGAGKNIMGGARRVIGTGKSGLQADAEQYAAKEGLENLKNKGYVRPVSEKFSFLL